MNLNPLRRIVTLICRKPTWRYKIVHQTRLLQQIRQISLSVRRSQEDTQEAEDEGSVKIGAQKRLEVDVDTSIRYMNSEAFKKCYKDEVIWKHYRRNHEGQLPSHTRYTCVRGDYTTTGNPCPICRDEYLVVDYRNTKLINHFTDPVTGEIYETRRTGVCQKQQKKLLFEKYKANEHGILEGNVPFRMYNYRMFDQEYGIEKKEVKKTTGISFAEWRIKRALAMEEAEAKVKEKS